MTDIEDLIAELRCEREEWSTVQRGVGLLVTRAADALESLAAERDALRAAIDEALEWGENVLSMEDVLALRRILSRATTTDDVVDLIELLRELRIARESRDAALDVMNRHRCGEQAEAAYRRAVRAETWDEAIAAVFAWWSHPRMSDLS